MQRSYEHLWDPTRRIISVADSRLNQLLLRRPERCATLSEYAQYVGIDLAEVLELFGPYLDDGTLALESFGDEVFLHTAPLGRPAPREHADVPPNLWERLRASSSLEMSFAVWRLIRSMERSGWAVETNAAKLLFGLAPLVRAPFFGIQVGAQVVPVLPFPSPVELAGPTSLLAEYSRAGASAVSVVCDAGALDEVCTHVRRWSLSHRYPPTMSVLVLEAPRYNPVLLAASDGSIEPVSVSRETALLNV